MVDEKLACLLYDAGRSAKRGATIGYRVRCSGTDWFGSGSTLLPHTGALAGRWGKRGAVISPQPFPALTTVGTRGRQMGAYDRLTAVQARYC